MFDSEKNAYKFVGTHEGAKGLTQENVLKIFKRETIDRSVDAGALSPVSMTTSPYAVLQTYFVESGFLNTVKDENDLAVAYVRKLNKK